jgi:hypothetical protein
MTPSSELGGGGGVKLEILKYACIKMQESASIEIPEWYQLIK